MFDRKLVLVYYKKYLTACRCHQYDTQSHQLDIALVVCFRKRGQNLKGTVTTVLSQASFITPSPAPFFSN
jgi:hypothetical protein